MDLLINRSAADLDAAQACHRAAFGLRPERCIRNEDVERVGERAPLGLLAKAGGSPAANDQLRNNARHLTPLDMDVVTPDLESALARTEVGALCRKDKIREANGAASSPRADPFGHGGCLIQFIGGGYDEIAATANPSDRSPSLLILIKRAPCGLRPTRGQ